jgi:thiosulfate/3-mercaptopyruvate sulfurtransferase
MQTLISTETLYLHLAEPDWAIVDCRFDLAQPDLGRTQYQAQHIPGASYAHLAQDLAGPKTGTNGRHPLPDPAALRQTFARLGIDSSAQVVAYDQDSGMYASRLWWLLRYMGHTAVAVLDGGFAKWVAEGRPTASGDEAQRPRAFAGTPNESMRTDVAEVARGLGDPSVRLIDARAPERYAGRMETIDRVAGHIPGAVNHFFKNNLAPDGTFLPASDLRARLDQALGGLSPDQAICYCGSGVTACHNLLAFEHAGLRGARLYVGSWSEWCADPERPVERERINENRIVEARNT